MKALKIFLKTLLRSSFVYFEMIGENLDYNITTASRQVLINDVSQQYTALYEGHNMT